MRILTFIALALLLALPARAQDTLIVLDVSNSMLTRVDGRTRLAVTREVVEALARAAPVRTRMGLMAFGHRRPADCEDIEILIAPGPVSAPVFARTTNLIPRGRTAIAGALHEAARSAQRILLVTDGGENCVPDPCVEARALKARQPNLVIQVIGFDVADRQDAAQLRCIAEATGGRYFDPNTRFELALAMAEAAGATPLALAPTGPAPRAAPPGTDTILTLEANEQQGGSPVTVDSWNLIALGETPRQVLRDNQTMQPVLRVPPGRYELRLAVGNARIVERFEVAGERMTYRAVTYIGTLRPLGSLAPARPARNGNWTVLADEVPGYRHGEQVAIAEAIDPVFRLTQGSYRLRFATGEATGEVPVFVDAGLQVSARVNLGAADVTLLPSRGGRPVPARAAEIRRLGDATVIATSNATRPRFVLPAGEWLARVRVENVWRDMPLSLTAGQEAELPLPVP